MEISQKLEVAELRELMGKLKAIGETYGDGIARKVFVGSLEVGQGSSEGVGDLADGDGGYC
jgi:hypothetical protein